MKPVLLASTALCALAAQGAFAASTTSAPAPAAAPFSWTGFYVGGAVGGLWSSDGVSQSVSGTPWGPSSDTLHPSGVGGGLQAGYNYQISNFVVGAEGDAEGDLEGSSARRSVGLAIFGATHSASLPFFADLRARAGVAFGAFLPYVTGGVVVADVKNTFFNDIMGLGVTSSRGGSSTGWVVGGGVEYAIDAHWSVKADYLYMQFPDATQTIVKNGYTFASKFKDSAQVARVGVAYRF